METNANYSSLKARNKAVIISFVLIAVGLLFLSFNFGWINPALKSVIFSWPMIFIVFSIVALIKREFLGFLFWLLLGGFFLLPRLTEAFPVLFPGIDADFMHNYWPVLLIVLGFVFLLKIVFGRNKHPFKKYINESNMEGVDGRVEKSVVFGGSENIVLDPVFNGGNIDIVFGGIVLDLRKTSLPAGDTVLNTDVVFGGISLYVPDDWKVVSRLDTVMGGFADKRLSAKLAVDSDRQLIIQGDLVFGGCDIR